MSDEHKQDSKIRRKNIKTVVEELGPSHTWETGEIATVQPKQALWVARYVEPQVVETVESTGSTMEETLLTVFAVCMICFILTVCVFVLKMLLFF